MVTLDFLEATAALFSVAFLAGLIQDRYADLWDRYFSLFVGLKYGVITLFSMMAPLVVTEGVRYDARGPLIALAGVFGGPISAFVAAVGPLGFRIYLGGTGLTSGVLSILSSTLIGIIAHYVYTRRRDRQLTWGFFLCIGTLCSLQTLTWSVFLPAHVRNMVLLDNGVAIGLVYLAATITFGLLEVRNSRSREAQKKLIENQRLIESAQKIGQFGFCIFDTKSSVLQLSSLLAPLFSRVSMQDNFTLDEFSEHYVSESDRGRLKGFAAQVIAGQVPEPVECQMCSDNEIFKTIWIHLVGWEKKPDRKCAVLMLQDVSDKSSLFEKMSHAARLATLGETAASIGHQIINPLTAARLAVESLERSVQNGTSTDERRLELIRRIDNRLGAITSLVNSISQFARAEALPKHPVSVHDTIYQAVDFFKEIAPPAHTPRIDLDCLAENDSVRGNDIHFQQVLLNLLNNALHATRNSIEPTIKIATQNSGGQLVVSVTDNGDGISPEFREKIFSPFFTTKERGKGTGLGLSIADAIVKDAGGHIDVDSEVGRGTAFRLQLPVLDN